MTIAEFAQAIGVSKTTVSRAIHGRGRISPTTRRMVLERMEELGFTPNLNAQRLSHGRTYMVALDFGPWHDYLSDMFFVELTRGIQDVLETRNYGLLLSGPGEALHRWVKTRAVDGVILCGPPHNSTHIEIAQTGTPCVVVDNHHIPDACGVGSVVIDLACAARQVARKLVECGHRRIGYIASTEGNLVWKEFRRELDRLGAPLAEARTIVAGSTPDDGARAMRALLAQKERPTAVFARTDMLAIGALHTAHQIGVRVPEELSLVGHDDVTLARWVQPPLTTVRIDCMELARRATESLFALLNDPGIRIKSQVVQAELVVRDSVSQPPAR